MPLICCHALTLMLPKDCRYDALMLIDSRLFYAMPLIAAAIFDIAIDYCRR